MEDEIRKEDYRNFYELGKKLGKGSFGEVFEAKYKKTKELKAIKIIFINDEEKIDIFMNELKGMKICSHTNTNSNSVKVYEYFKYKKEFVIVMELCDDTLFNILERRKEPFKPEEIYEIMSQLNNTFKIMVKNGIVHRDIKLENILVKYEDEQKKNLL